MKKEVVIIGSITLVVLGGIIAYSYRENNTPGPLDGFATCLKDKGVKFFGAFWCPHCQREKALFGRSARLLPYIECSTPDAKGQLQICKDNHIEGYPTWEFPGGGRLTGEIPLQTLAASSSCQLPQ